MQGSFGIIENRWFYKLIRVPFFDTFIYPKHFGPKSYSNFYVST